MSTYSQNEFSLSILRYQPFSPLPRVTMNGQSLVTSTARIALFSRRRRVGHGT
jgi:hypothetical protein